MPSADAFADKEVAQFLDLLPRQLTFTEMAAACLQQFGAARAWSRSRIIRYWDAAYPVRKGLACRIDGDGELRAFLDDHIGRDTLDRTLDACIERFGRERTPSRSTIHRYWKRSRLARKANSEQGIGS